MVIQLNNKENNNESYNSNNLLFERSLFSGTVVAASDFDTSKPLVCAIFEVLDCDVYNECACVNANAVNLPDMFRMNIKKEGNGRAWSVVLSESTGKFTGAVAAEDFGFLNARFRPKANISKKKCY